ncbi:hypothetical protein C8F04DRAFT_1228679 [Mycena alexandri]|uniref:Uncharacterized protein n=1 Tax=Mycena alexandri TaxID=1745969 RepID=A0AAD6TFR5_9AGAR|nr:hypothetical protein C8F04DRAFT_1228679 [Mycena alexandri]
MMVQDFNLGIRSVQLLNGGELSAELNFELRGHSFLAQFLTKTLGTRRVWRLFEGAIDLPFDYFTCSGAFLQFSTRTTYVLSTLGCTYNCGYKQKGAAVRDTVRRADTEVCASVRNSRLAARGCADSTDADGAHPRRVQLGTGSGRRNEPAWPCLHVQSWGAKLSPRVWRLHQRKICAEREFGRWVCSGAAVYRGGRKRGWCGWGFKMRRQKRSFQGGVLNAAATNKEDREAAGGIESDLLVRFPKPLVESGQTELSKYHPVPDQKAAEGAESHATVRAKRIRTEYQFTGGVERA